MVSSQVVPTDARIFVAGHRGLVGSAILRALDARGYKWKAHKNKDGQEYPTNAGYERY